LISLKKHYKGKRSMKKRVVCLLLVCLAIFAGFKLRSYATKAGKVAKSQKIVRYHVVITDKCNSDFSKRLLESVKEAVDGKIFVLTRNLGVMLKDAAEREKIPLMESRVGYKMIADPIEPVPGDEKLTLRFNPPDAEGIYNADFLHFVYNRDRTWERGYNPGSFCFDRESSDMAQLRDRLVRLLSRIPFK